MPQSSRSILVFALIVAGCGSSGGPTAQPTQTPPTPAVTTGIVVDSLAGTPISGVQINVDGFGLFTSGADGTFSLTAIPPQSPHQVTLTSDSTVQRTTRVNLPGTVATVSLIGSGFD